jgi:hypothetical protein
LDFFLALRTRQFINREVNASDRHKSVPLPRVELNFYCVVSDLLDDTRMVRRRQTKSAAVAETADNGEGSHSAVDRCKKLKLVKTRSGEKL